MPAHNENTRLETFCDGVFAIAITLLILEIKIPHESSIHSTDDLWQALIHLWPSFFAFGMGFLTILIAWFNHHSMMKLVLRSSPKFIFANGFFLLTIVVLPFSAGMLGEYVNTEYVLPAAVFYTFCGFLHNAGWNLLFYTALRPEPLTSDPVNLKGLKDGKRLCFYGLLFYVVLFGLSWWLPRIAIMIQTLTWFAWLYVGIMYSGPKKKGQEAVPDVSLETI